MITRFFLKVLFRIKAKYFNIPDTLLDPEFKHRKRFRLLLVKGIDFTKQLLKGKDVEYHETWGNTKDCDEHIYRTNNVRWCTSFGLVRMVTKYEPKGVEGWYLNEQGSITKVERDYTSGMLRFLDKLKPGYMYSFRMQCADFIGSWTAVWLHTQLGDGTYLEFDILEQFYKDISYRDEIQVNAQFGTAKDRKHIPLKIKGFPFSYKPFDIDMLWLEDLIEVYINGVKVYKLKNHKFVHPMTLLMNVGVYDFGNGCERVVSDKNAVFYHVNKYKII